MTRPFAHAPRQLLSARERLAAVLAALTASGAIAAALVLVFLDASPAVWLAPELDLSDRLASCDRLSARDAREQCRRDFAAARLETHKRPQVVTKHEAEAR